MNNRYFGQICTAHA